MDINEPAACQPNFWSSVTWPWTKNVIIVGITLFLVTLGVYREPALSDLGLALAGGLVLGMALVWVLCRVAIAWIRWPSGSR